MDNVKSLWPLNVTCLLPQVEYVAQNIAGFHRERKRHSQKNKTTPYLNARSLHRPLLLSCLWQYGLSWGSFHSCEQGTIRGLVIHLGWSRCLGLPIAIIIPIHTNPPLPGLSAAKGTDYQKKKKQFGGARACCDHWCQNGYERQVLCSLWYLSVRGRAGEGMRPQRQVSQVGGLVLDWSMHASKGDNSTHHRSPQKSNLRKRGAEIYIEWKIC